jgi:biotin transport system substrate-specific component
MSTQVSHAPRYVLADLLPGARVRDAVLVTIGTASVALASQASISMSWIESNLHIPLPGTPVPLSLSTFAVLLTGMSLGPIRAGLSMLTFMVAGMAGVPWFAQQNHGWNFASFGYIIGYFAAAVVIGELARRRWDRTPLRTIAIALLGSLIIYACGLPWLMGFLDVGFDKGYELGVKPFIPGDIIKSVAAALLLPATWAAVHRYTDDDPSATSSDE